MFLQAPPPPPYHATSSRIQKPGTFIHIDISSTQKTPNTARNLRKRDVSKRDMRGRRWRNHDTSEITLGSHPLSLFLVGRAFVPS